MLELVVPAPDYNTALIAIKSGADSIYAPIENIVNLRFKAPFFNLSNLKKIISKAHRNDKKVYAVLNQSVSEENFIFFCETIERLIILGIDGIVLGDIGLIKWAREHFKRYTVKIIASSVMGIVNKYDITFIEKLGLDRIIIPRLVTGEGLADICNASSSEIEIYVHGNLCPSWDGASCRLIHLYNNTLNNICISKDPSFTPCLKKFYLHQKNNNKNLWETIVQCDIALIPWFNKIGITSLKIIPANISPFYIKKVINIWREALDSYYNDPDNWKIKDSWIQALQMIHHLPLRMDMYYLGRNF